MRTFFVFLLVGVSVSAVYAISATGLVVTYLTSGVFNFAHGAIGMFLAFVYWELRVNQGWPTFVALAVTLLVVAPILGALLDLLIMRRLLAGASVATKLVVTLALLLAFQGAAYGIWGTELRTLDNLWGDRSFSVAGLVINWDQVTMVLTAVGVAVALRMLFRHTRLGVAMRAVVDSPELCALTGLSPNLVTATSWALGAMLAGLAAILIAPGLNLEVNTLSLLVVSAYAAAVVGRLESLPATFLGALVLGIGQVMLTGYLPGGNEIVQNLRPALPFVLLFIALLARQQKRLPEKLRTPAQPSPPPFKVTAAVGALAVVAAAGLSGFLSSFQLLIGSKGLAFAAVTISLALLTGLSGQVSLMQMSFAGIGAIAMAKLPAGMPYLAALPIAALIAGVVGALIALPAIRLRGIYLALLTLAFAILMDGLVFGNSRVFGGGATLVVGRPTIFGISFQGERSMFILLTVAVVIFANVFLAVRRSSFGRMLAAMRDAPTACQTLGMSLTTAKLKVFGLSALLAGTAGALLGSLQVRVGQLDFLWFKSLAVLLVATIFGISSIGGAMLGALFFAVLPEVTRKYDAGAGGQALQPLIIGLLAMATARRPEGIAGRLSALFHTVWRPRPVKLPVSNAATAVDAPPGEPELVEAGQGVPLGS